MRKTIDLKLPKSWNQCGVEQLETIASVMKDRAKASSRYNPFSMYDVKVDLFFALTGIEPVGAWENDGKGDRIVCRLKPKGRSLMALIKPQETFEIYLWQIQGWIEKELKWMDDRKASGLTLFPYPNVRRGWWQKRFEGPSALMQDFSWQRYRFAQDYLGYYTMQQNIAQEMIRHPRRYTKKAVQAQHRELDRAKSLFLATIYNARIPQRDTVTGKTRRQFAFTDTQVEDNARYFRRFDENRFQVILFWWQGMMRYLQTKYPRCYKEQKMKGDSRSPNPLELYTRMTATMEKYLGLTEEMVNGQMFHVILQHLDDMVKENEEIKRMKK